MSLGSKSACEQKMHSEDPNRFERESTLSRAPTHGSDLYQLEPIMSRVEQPVYDWHLRSVGSNDFFLRDSFDRLLAMSATLPPDERVIMYDACDDHEVFEQIGIFRKRLDARRNTKPKKPDAQRNVCTPFGTNPF